MKKAKTQTAAEVTSRLGNNPEYVELQANREIKMSLQQADYDAEMQPIRSDLKELGVDVDLYELVQKYGKLSPEITNILLKWLPRCANVRVLEGLVRALGYTKDTYDGQELVVLFEKTDNLLLKWTIANTIAEAKPANITNWVVEAVKNPANRKSREMLILATARMADQEVAIFTLRSLLKEFPGFVAMAFAECGGKDEVALLQENRDKGKSWERKKIEQAIISIEKRLARGSKG